MASHISIAEMAKALNRPVVYLVGLQKRFELPVCESYSAAYVEFLRKIVHLRIMGVSEDRLVDLWKTEKHLLDLLHFKGDGTPTWFLDECTHAGHRERRLLLTHHDMGEGFNSKTVQPGLDFNPSSGGLFTQREIGDDALRVLGQYRKLANEVLAIVEAESDQLRAAVRRITGLRAQTI